MKKGIFFLILLVVAASTTSNAQKLKDLLYSGKLKKDSSGVVRKTDDLSTKIDTTQNKGAEKGKATSSVAPSVRTSTDSNTVSNEVVVNSDPVMTEAVDGANEEVVPVKAAPVKTNTKIWREYTDELAAGMKDVLSSKKIKKETYYLMAEYELDPDGTVTILNVTCSPENEILQNQVKDRMLTNPPKLNPIEGGTKKVKRKQNFSITKD